MSSPKRFSDLAMDEANTRIAAIPSPTLLAAIGGEGLAGTPFHHDRA
jgi:hypothetical protein